MVSWPIIAASKSARQNPSPSLLNVSGSASSPVVSYFTQYYVTLHEAHIVSRHHAPQNYKLQSQSSSLRQSSIHSEYDPHSQPFYQLAHSTLHQQAKLPSVFLDSNPLQRPHHRLLQWLCILRRWLISLTTRRFPQPSQRPPLPNFRDRRAWTRNSNPQPPNLPQIFRYPKIKSTTFFSLSDAIAHP
jgi:hypothetical protein